MFCLGWLSHEPCVETGASTLAPSTRAGGLYSISNPGAAVGRLAPAAYLLAFALFITPLLDASSRILPMRPGEVGWRFGAMGIVFNTLVTPLLGLFLAMLAAAVLGHRRTLRWLSVASYVATVVVALSLVLFVFDYLQARAGVVTERRGAVDVVSVKALFLGALGMIVAAGFGRAGWNASKVTDKTGRLPPSLAWTPKGSSE